MVVLLQVYVAREEHFLHKLLRQAVKESLLDTTAATLTLPHPDNNNNKHDSSEQEQLRQRREHRHTERAEA